MGLRRIGHSDWTTVIGAGMVAAAVAVGGGAALIGGLWWLLTVAAVAFGALAWRLIQTGVYVSDDGIRVRHLLSTESFAWRSVLAVRVRKIVLGSPFDNSGDFFDVRMICFDLADGSTIDTLIHGQLRGGLRSWRTPAVLPTERFDRVLAELRHRVAVGATAHGQPAE
jgi:hypothetical protein